MINFCSKGYGRRGKDDKIEQDVLAVCIKKKNKKKTENLRSKEQRSEWTNLKENNREKNLTGN